MFDALDTIIAPVTYLLESFDAVRKLRTLLVQ